jgi:2-polyprenyl-3-methyl-5-hydroxy-6-metoxy-1,4-benzoquinol methylase
VLDRALLADRVRAFLSAVPGARRTYDALVNLRTPKEGLEGGGERVDIDVSHATPSYESLDIYEKSHWRRYEFALDHVVPGGVSGDFACGTGYGSVLLADKSSRVIGADVDHNLVRTISRRYRHVPSVSFVCSDLLQLDFSRVFDTIVSFETIEHFAPADVTLLFAIFARALKHGGILILSTPYMQPASPEALAMGFHRTFLIDEARLISWLEDGGFVVKLIRYQSYATHDIVPDGIDQDFLIAVATLSDA